MKDRDLIPGKPTERSPLTDPDTTDQMSPATTAADHWLAEQPTVIVDIINQIGLVNVHPLLAIAEYFHHFHNIEAPRQPDQVEVFASLPDQRPTFDDLAKASVRFLRAYWGPGQTIRELHKP